MGKSRRPLKRKTGKRSYRKLFVIAVEGKKTETQYFSIFKKKNLFNLQKPIIQIDCIKGNNKSSPHYVLDRMKKSLKEKNFKHSDEAWLVVDMDHWNDEQLRALYKWTQEANNRGLALSNPKFEYCLLLHFEEGKNVNSAKSCSERLKKHLPDYDKNIDTKKITLEQIRSAIKRAKQRDNPPCSDWPRTSGTTTVYKLIENIFKANGEYL